MKQATVRYRMVYVIVGLVAAVILAVIRCAEEREQQAVGPPTLTVLMRYAPTIIYEDTDGMKGFEYELVSAFAEHMDMRLEVKLYDDVAEILAAVEDGEGDFASAAITRTQGRSEEYLFGPGYYTVQQLVVYRRGNPYPDTISDLADFDLLVAAGSSYAERLRSLKEEYPRLSWSETDSLSTEQMMNAVWEGDIDLTVADQNIVAINRRYYPGLEVAMPISEQQQLAWVLPADSRDMTVRMREWLDSFEDSGALGLLRDKYYSYVEIYDFVDVREFHRRIKTILPEYRQWFMEAAGKNDFPWTLLAAQSYQESHWNPRAKSPTGVRGIMMLTQRTARTVGVTNRLDPYQNILGGAQYLRRVLERVPDSVRPSDRLYFALAGYNVGMGHLHDARRLAEILGKNPDHWLDVRGVLPLLTNKEYYTTLRHGYARGTEPVRYVRRIRNYRNILEKEFSPLP